MRHKAFLFPLILLWFGIYSHAQLWSGIIDPSRAIDWTQAGVPGGIPNRTVQCGSTIAAYTGSAATINNAIAACPNDGTHFVSLGAGTFNLSSGIDFGQRSNITVRGQGGNSTFVVFSGTTGCNGYNPVVCMAGSNNSPGYGYIGEENVCDWTAGYAQRTTAITLANCGSTMPARGALSNLKVGSILILDQVDEVSDTGQIWNCSAQNICANTIPAGYARNSGPAVGGMAVRDQEQAVVVTACGTKSTIGQACDGGNITISPGLYMPNWRSGQSPQAWFANTSVTGMGIENLSIDRSGVGGAIIMANCNGCWVKGVRSLNGGRNHVGFEMAVHSTVRDSYFYQNQSHSSVSYGIELNNSFDNLVENNISQQITDSLPNNNGPSAGNVNAYNFAVDDIWGGNGWMQPPFYQHAAGDEFYLWEGNIGTGYDADSVHGTHHFNTLFRNYLIGTQNSPTTTCVNVGDCNQTVPVVLTAGARYINVIGNVLGQAGYHNNYQCLGSASTCADNQSSIYAFGFTGETVGQPNSSIAGFCLQPSCSNHGDYDPQVLTYLMRWGNYDTVNAEVRFVNSEVPSGVSPYGNAVPASPTLPASFHYSSKPTWWGSTLSWPPIGPDVTGGSISGVGGHVNMNPAMACYMNVMGGPADGSGGALKFNAGQCYGSSSGSGVTPPSGLAAVVQ